MPQLLKPFFKTSRGLWYVAIDRRQINLGPDREAAWQRYHELMATPRSKAGRSDHVACIIDAFLEWTQKERSPESNEWCRYWLQRFVDRYPHLRAAELKPYHVQQRVDSYTLSVTSRRNFLQTIKRRRR